MDRLRPVASAMDGVLVINKPVGPTSHDIVACARRAFGISRVGHTGTLDPNASGVLPLVLGRATRLAQFLSGREKEYLATVRFGRSTDTYDALGTVVTDDGPIPSRAEIEAALEAFRGTFDQMPPPHSAKKVDGVRAYKRARAAVPVALRPARVTVTRLDLLDMDGADVRLQVACSAGFYVRSLAHDLGTALGSGALLQALTRTRSGVFGLDGSVDLATLAQHPDVALTAVHSMDEMLPEIPAVHLTADGARKARHGQSLGPADMVRRVPGGFVGGAEATRENGADATRDNTATRLLGPDGHLLGLARPGDVAGTLRPSVIVG